MLKGYKLNNRKGLVFTTSMRIVAKHGTFVCEPLVIAEPGDLVLVEGEVLQNITKAAAGDPRVSYYAANAVFTHAS